MSRKGNPFHGFLNGLIPVCLQCVPAPNISPLMNFTANFTFLISLANCAKNFKTLGPKLWEEFEVQDQKVPVK